jgi:hypothetical protein
VSGKLTFEWGPRNLTTFMRNHTECGPEAAFVKTPVENQNAEQKQASATAALACVNTIDTYAKDAATDRLAFSLEYDRTNRRWIDLPDYSVQYGIPRAHKLVYSLTYGRPLTAPMGASGARIDLSVDYEDVSNDAEVDNRLVGSATFTYKVSDKVSIPVGIVYASHEEDLAANDEQLNAHFGLIYKMPDLGGLFNVFGKK